MNEVPRRLPVWATAIESWRLVGTRWREILVIGWAPAVLIIALTALTVLIDPFAPLGFPGSLIELIIWSIVSAFLLVPWHRLVLLDQVSAGGLNAFRVRRPHLRFIERLVLLGLPFSVLALDTSMAPTAPTIVIFASIGAGLAMVYIVTRLALSLPALALGHDGSFERSWRLTRTNGWSLFLASLFASLPLAVPVFMFSVWAAYVGEDALLALASPLRVVFVLLEAAVLSVAYRILGGMEEARAGEAIPTASP